MPFTISRRAQRVKPSPTLAVTALANRLKAEGKDIISLGAGEPDFDTPTHIADAGVAAIRSGFTRYTNVDGMVELKDAIIAKFKRDNGISYERNQVLVSSGAKQTIYNLCMAVLDPGDEVIIPAPYWVSYPDMVLLADGIPVTPSAGPEQGYKISPRQLQAAITPKTRMVMFNSPSNPTGAVYSEEELSALGEIAVRRQLIVISDDIYEHFSDRPLRHIGALVPALRPRLVAVNSVSKTYAMTGWRLGYAAAPVELIRAMTSLQSQSTSNPPSTAQAAAIAALGGSQESVAVMAREFRARREIVLARLAAIPDVTVVRPEGAFYVFPDVSAYLGRRGPDGAIVSTGELATHLLRHVGVAVVAGEGFGAPGYVRISYAAERSVLEDGIDRLARGLAALR